MMAWKVLEHPVLGDRVIVLTTTEESGGKLFRFEYIAHAATPPAENHLHEAQEERVIVLAGTLHCRLGEEERVLRGGDTLVIPPGTPHAVWNEDPSGCRSIGEFRPALDAQQRFESYFTAAA